MLGQGEGTGLGLGHWEGALGCVEGHGIGRGEPAGPREGAGGT